MMNSNEDYSLSGLQSHIMPPSGDEIVKGNVLPIYDGAPPPPPPPPPVQ